MADENDDGLDKAFEGFGEEPEQPVVTPPADDPNNPTPPAPAAATPPADEEPNKDDKTPPAKPKDDEEELTPPADPAKKPEEGAEPPKAPETPPAPAEPEEPKPLTADDVTSIISNMRQEERSSGKELETTTNDVLEAYYPDGLSNVLVDGNSGKQLKSPQDVVDASGGEMSMDAAAQWLMDEQFKLDQNIAKIKSDAQSIAETTINFKRDSVTVLQKYEPLFKAYPALQEKTFKKLMKLVKSDTEKSVVLSAPDVIEFYDDALEPYQQAYEYATKQSATNTVPAPGAETPVPTPGAEDRLDEDGDGGVTPPNDPNDFGQQVSKELAKGL